MTKFALTLTAVASLTMANHAQAEGGYSSAEMAMLAAEAAKGDHNAQMIIVMRARAEEVEKDLKATREYYQEYAKKMAEAAKANAQAAQNANNDAHLNNAIDAEANRSNAAAGYLNRN